MKNFFLEFKKFVTRGNIVDMAVGVIVGSSFTAVVNGLSNFILKPIINAIIFLIMGKGGLENVYTPLVKNYMLNDAGEYILNEADEKILDLANSIYIDWGAFISAVINFFIVAFVLFCIVRTINKIREGGKKLEEEARSSRPSKEDRREMRRRGIKFSDTDAVAAYFEEKAQKEAEAKAAAEEKARLEKEANPSTEELLKQIRDLLKDKQ